MFTIDISDVTVKEIIRSVCVSVTGQIAGVYLTESSSASATIDNPLSVVVMSRGKFMSKAVMTLSHNFADKIVDSMSKGEKLSQDEREAYFQEFVNIFFGRFISAVNNETGHPSRFVIPVVLHGTYQETTETIYKNRVEVDMDSSEGRLSIVMKYDVIPEFSSSEA